MKQFSCGDVVPGCQRTFRGADDDQVLAQVAGHAKDDHDLAVLSPALLAQVRGSILAV